MTLFEQIILDMQQMRLRLLPEFHIDDTQQAFLEEVIKGADINEAAAKFGYTPLRAQGMYELFIKKVNRYLDHSFKNVAQIKPITQYYFGRPTIVREPMPYATPDLSTPLHDLDLRLRSFKILRYLGVKTLGDLQLLSVKQIKDVRTSGVTALKDIQREMNHHGLRPMRKK